MAQQFLAFVYQSTQGNGFGTVTGGPMKNTGTPVYLPFPSAGVLIHPKTNFERFFATNGQPPAPFWDAVNAVIEDTETGVLYSATQTVSALTALANAS